MPAILVPDSYGEPIEIEPWDPLREKWSDSARMASAEARRRRVVIQRLNAIRTDALNKLTSQMVKDTSMGRPTGIGKGISPIAAKHWKRSNDVGKAIDKILRIKATDSRPLLARFKKQIKRMF